jgi:hypothetical protein
VEARAAAASQHPNVVRVYEVGVDVHGRPFLVMELVVGSPFGATWPRPAPVAAVVAAADAMLAGVEAAHRLGIVHRDLKPDNVLVTAERGAVVLDFGVAKLVEDPASPALTVTGERLGTPRYMAPEQITGAAIDARADVYALGAMLYEALAGEPPFPGDAVFALYQAHLNETPAPLAARGVPAAVAAVVERALAKEPARRHADAGALRRALIAAATKRPRRRLRAAIVAAVAVAAIVGVGAAARLTEPAAPAPTAPIDPTAVVYVVPPADVPLDPNLERALATTAQYLAQMPRASRIQALCGMVQVLRSPYFDAKMRSFYTRYALLLHEGLPGEDPAKLCPHP